MFFHPYSCDFIKYLNQYGIGGLLGPKPGDTEEYRARRQRAHVYHTVQEDWFDTEYGAEEAYVDTPYPTSDIEFSRDGAYSHYNWEIFFHAPLLIADRLSKNQRFEEAMTWFHYIFDPTETADGDPPMRYWKVRPFYDLYSLENGVPKRIQELMVLLSKGDPAMQKQITEWETKPFKPHAIARLRPAAYMKTVVMKYIDNLIAWGDQLFRQYTMESINEATQLYILAADILGSRPEQVPGTKRAVSTYRQLETQVHEIDRFGNVLVKIEDKLPASAASPSGGSQYARRQSRGRSISGSTSGGK